MAHTLSWAVAGCRWLVIAALGVPVLAYPANMQVAPVRMVLTPTRPISAMTVGNGEDSEIAVQAEVFEWSQEDGEDVYRATQDVLVNPAIFKLAGEGQQIVRLGLRVANGPREHSYRIFMQQLPRDQALPEVGAPGAQVQTLLRVSVPIFVPPVVATQDMQWRG